MMLLKKVAILGRRALRARSFGVNFNGTTRFRVQAIRIQDHVINLSLPNEVGISWDFIDIFLDDQYGLRQLCMDPKTILDVGANCGLFSLLAAHHFPTATITAFEPNPLVFHHAKKNLAPLGIRVVQAGIASRPGYAEMREREPGSSRSMFTVASDKGPVELVSLGTAIDGLGDKIDLLKLDCEGAEWDIFNDTDALRRVRVIVMEYHLVGNRSVEDFKALVRKRGFSIDFLEPKAPNFGMARLTARRRIEDQPFRLRPSSKGLFWRARPAQIGGPPMTRVEA